MAASDGSLWPTVLKMTSELYGTFYHVGESWFRVLVPRKERPIANQVVLITGSSKMLGRELALRFARRGARLVLWDSDLKEQEVTKEYVTSNVKGARVNGYQVDFEDTSSTRKCAESVISDVGPVDLVVHTYETPLRNIKMTDLKSQDLEKDFNGNVLSLFNVVDSILPQLRRTGKGQIVSVAGLVGHLGLPHLSSYCMSKFAVVGFLDALRAELKSEGLDDITVTELSPYHCLAESSPNKCTGVIADEATTRILRNESKIMIPLTWATFLMTLKFLMPVESLLSLSRAIGTGELIFKALAQRGRERMDRVITSIEKSPQPEGLPSSAKPNLETEKNKEGTTDASTPANLSEPPLPQGSPGSSTEIVE